MTATALDAFDPRPDNPRAWRADDPSLRDWRSAPHEVAGLVRFAIAGTHSKVLRRLFHLEPHELRATQEFNLGLRQRADRLGQPIHEPVQLEYINP